MINYIGVLGFVMWCIIRVWWDVSLVEFNDMELIEIINKYSKYVNLVFNNL